VMQQSSGLRRPGSAALDLAWMAAGRYDAFFETGLKSWDIAAGCLLVTEAGGMVSDLAGNQNYVKTGHICAGNPDIHPQLLKIIAPHLTAELKA
jgi:myo-inositol-1(or 4)-monophosphatase